MKLSSCLTKSLILAALLGTTAVFAADSDPVVAKINDTEIHETELKELEGMFPPQLIEEAKKKDSEKFRLTLIRQLIDLKLVIAEAKKLGLEKSDKFKKDLDKIIENLLFKEYIVTEVGKVVNEEAVRKAYEEERKNLPKDVMETRARHILVKDEKTAKELIKKLDEGADFIKLVQDYSMDKQSESGDLGFFLKDDFVPEFTEAAFKLEPGKYTKQPIKTQFGYHIIRVEDRRRAQPKPIEEVKGRIEATLTEAAMKKLVEKLRSAATVTVFDKQGKPIKDALKDDDKPVAKTGASK